MSREFETKMKAAATKNFYRLAFVGPKVQDHVASLMRAQCVNEGHSPGHERFNSTTNSKTRASVYSFVKAKGPVTQSEIREALGLSAGPVSKALALLSKRGTVQRTGTGPYRYFIGVKP